MSCSNARASENGRISADEEDDLTVEHHYNNREILNKNNDISEA